MSQNLAGDQTRPGARDFGLLGMSSWLAGWLASWLAGWFSGLGWAGLGWIGLGWAGLGLLADWRLPGLLGLQFSTLLAPWLLAGWLAAGWLAARGFTWALLDTFGPWAHSGGFIWTLLSPFGPCGAH